MSGIDGLTNQNPNKSYEVVQPPTDSIYSQRFSSKCNYIVATSWDNQVLCLSWKDDGMTVFLEGCDKQVKIWPLTYGGQLVTVVIHDVEP
ncbi:hypothetical protein C5167_017255 [Papaver somniferum]|uniref:Uncharacterized protein n=1 Tax=Papaver somniferum TaxID=3469 RepID=A0A4Y7IIX3_PAPSO|nr:hypothetical protein C5167_017255 [Papaver somniferum]